MALSEASRRPLTLAALEHICLHRQSPRSPQLALMFFEKTLYYAAPFPAAFRHLRAALPKAFVLPGTDLYNTPLPIMTTNCAANFPVDPDKNMQGRSERDRR